MYTYHFTFTDHTNKGNQLLADMETSKLDEKSLNKFIKSQLDELNKLVSYFGDIEVNALDEIGRVVVDGTIIINVFSGKTDMKVHLRDYHVKY